MFDSAFYEHYEEFCLKEIAIVDLRSFAYGFECVTVRVLPTDSAMGIYRNSQSKHCDRLAKINLQELHPHQQVVGHYPLFFPPPSSHNASFSCPITSGRRTGRELCT